MVTGVQWSLQGERMTKLQESSNQTLETSDGKKRWLYLELWGETWGPGFSICFGLGPLCHCGQNIFSISVFQLPTGTWEVAVYLHAIPNGWGVMCSCKHKTKCPSRPSLLKMIIMQKDFWSTSSKCLTVVPYLEVFPWEFPWHGSVSFKPLPPLSEALCCFQKRGLPYLGTNICLSVLIWFQYMGNTHYSRNVCFLLLGGLLFFPLLTSITGANTFLTPCLGCEAAKPALQRS